MKNILILAVLFFSLQISYAQEKTIHPNENTIYSSVGIDKKPEFVGGIEEFHKFIAKNYVIPNEAKDKKGKIFLSFVVEIDGSISNIKLLKDLDFGTGEEAIRVLKLSPKWIPGEMKDQKVRSTLSLPISI